MFSFTAIEESRETIEGYRNLLLKELYIFPNLEQLLISEKWESVHEKIMKIFNCLAQIPDNRREYLSEVYYVLIYCFLSYCHQQQISLHHIIKMHENPSESLHDVSPFLMKNKMTAILNGIMEEVRTNKKATINIVNKAKQFMQTNLDGDVSLQAISDYLYLHPTSLTRLFKLETGESIGEYLLHLRMEKAARLLENKRIKICDIAQKLGYQSSSYFIQVFKKNFGVTPIKYRQNQIEPLNSDPKSSLS